jgi:predicted component of type VI protein secretion system
MAQAMPKLVFIDRRFAGRSYTLAIEKTSVGRSEENTLVIRDASLSSRHCEILVYGTEVIVRDLGSRNGTKVGERLLRNQQAPVKNGDIVRFGLVDARVEMENPEWNEDTSPETAVIVHRHVMRDQRRAQKNPAPADPSAKLDSGSGSAEGDTEPKTILLPGSDPAASAADPGETPMLVSRDKPRGRSLVWIGVAVAAAGLLWLAWWILNRQ